MIELRHVTKRFSAVTAVNDLSFQAPAGQIIGLLGQNGAGKTTTLNMLTGFFPPSSGQVLVQGQDMLLHPRECKRQIGYLPEQPPLYDEMTVQDYLLFVSTLREVLARSARQHVEEIATLCGLKDMLGRRIGTLSKGYRQRVGFAQALCGNPPVLVLDEPTVGLDPRQVVEIRELMRTLGRQHTILFSSHLLSEVQQLCSRVLILHRGRLIRDVDLSADRQEAVVLHADIAATPERLTPVLRCLPGIRRVRVDRMAEGITRAELECDPAIPHPEDALFRSLCALDAPIRSLQRCGNTLEEIFLRATQEEQP